MLEASVDDVVLDKVDGRFHVAGTPSVSRSWGEIAVEAESNGGLKVEHSSSPPAPTFPFGSHVAVVEVDTETGQV
jgi:carbon-monoxide dehydrogenase large subunit